MIWHNTLLDCANKFNGIYCTSGYLSSYMRVRVPAIKNDDVYKNPQSQLAHFVEVTTRGVHSATCISHMLRCIIRLVVDMLVQFLA